MAALLFREYRDDSWGLVSAGGGEVWWQLHSLESTGMTAGGWVQLEEMRSGGSFTL